MALSALLTPIWITTIQCGHTNLTLVSDGVEGLVVSSFFVVDNYQTQSIDEVLKLIQKVIIQS